MADAAIARREARRRRILENSHNRLQLISGKTADDTCRESPILSSTPDPIQRDEIPILTSTSESNRYSLNNGVIAAEPNQFCFLRSHDDVAVNDREVFNDLAALIPPAVEPIQIPLREKLISYKYDVVLLSLLTQVLYSLSIVTFDNTFFFVPLIVYSVTKLLWFSKPPTSSLAHTLLMLNGISGPRADKILQFTQYSGAVSQDVCVFLFTTICIQSLCITLSNIST